MAVGDMLRGHYQQLSADPNPLANLDQGLPNNLQHEVPVFSLPEDWLWISTTLAISFDMLTFIPSVKHDVSAKHSTF